MFITQNIILLHHYHIYDFLFQNLSLDEAVKEHFNGNDKCNMDSLGFGFNVGIEPDKVKDTGLIQDFERIQKDTTDFCNIQVSYLVFFFVFFPVGLQSFMSINGLALCALMS